MKVAAIDIGTNSVLLLIAERKAGGLVPVVERATITRLGEGVDRTRELARSARARTLACLATYAEELARHAPERVAVVGTSAMRDARGGEEFAAEAERLLGVRPLVVSGAREAELTFRGSLSGLELSGPVAVFDVGGGSTEIVVGHAADTARIDSAKSLDIGSVRLFERHVRSDPPSDAELDAVRRNVDSVLLAEAPIPADAALVGVAGTVTTLAAVAGAIEPYDAARVHGARITLATVRDVAHRLASLSLAERTKLPGLEPRRADVIVAGALLVERFLTWSQTSELIVSDRGVRWGLAEELAELS
ncbi:MAG TPA: Ppx/GppA phosphatase family protein [Polyangiaceae bacterium]